MAPRANWKGVLKIGEVACPVALFTAVSTAQRIAFHTLNRKTGNRLHRIYVDQETGKPVESADQIKGYDVGNGQYVTFAPEEIQAVIPDSDKTLAIAAFVACPDIDDIYFDKPYYLAPATPAAAETFVLLRESMRSKKVAALARAVLFRRMRSVLVRAHGRGLIATTLNFDYEVRSAAEAFQDISDIRIEGEMLDLAKHIIKMKTGQFDPASFEDRYDAALAELVKAKAEGRQIEAPKPPAETKVTDLLEVLRRSAKEAAKSKPGRRKKVSPSSKKAKAA